MGLITLREVYSKASLLVPDDPRVEDISLTQIPRRYQLDDFKRLITWRVANNFSHVGTGKSLVSYLYIFHKLLTTDSKVVVVMPPALIPQYARSLDDIAPQHGFNVQSLHLPLRECKDLLQRYKKGLEEYPQILLLSVNGLIKYGNTLAGCGHYGVLIADECHFAKNSATKVWSMLYRLVYVDNYDYLGMTGTPIKADLTDAYAYIKLKKPDRYRTIEQFEREHVIYKGLGKTKRLIGYKKEQVLTDNLNYQSVRNRADKVLSLDEPQIVEHLVQLSPEHRKFYQDFMSERCIELGDKLLVASNQSALRMLAMRVITNISTYSADPVEDEPLNNLNAIVDSINPVKSKVIIFCHFRETVEKICGTLKFYNPKKIYGGTNQVSAFLENQESRILVCNMTSGGVGLNLQHESHHIIFFETCGTPATLEQCIGRCQRSGQRHKVMVWVFNYRATFWSRLLKSALGRDAITSEALLDKKTFLQQLYL